MAIIRTHPILYEPRSEKTGLRGFRPGSIQTGLYSHRKWLEARGLKFRIEKVEGLYYLCSENKGADQLRGHRKADLRLCFRICKRPVFSERGSCTSSKGIGQKARSKELEQCL